MNIWSLPGLQHMQIKSCATGCGRYIYTWVYQEVGVAMYKMYASLFHNYLYSHSPRPHILETCMLLLARYNPKYTLQTLRDTPFCTYFNLTQIMVTLKSTCAVVGKQKWLGQEVSVVYVWVYLKVWVCTYPEVDVTKSYFSFFFSALIFICNHIPRTYILKIMKVR